MAIAATISSTSLTRIYEALPCYDLYGMQYNAETDESTFRLTLAQTLRDMGDRMLNFAEVKGPGLDPTKLEIIDALVDGIGECLKVMNRRGEIECPDGNLEGISELETVDNQLIMLLEHMTSSIDSLIYADPALFPINAHDLTVFIDAFSGMVEERNRLLGMGWESEIRLGLYAGTGQVLS